MAADVAIIGLGPAGHKIALLALKKGLKVICFEKCFVGGTCLNVGCIPTKALLHDSVNGANWSEMLVRKNNIVEKFRRAIEKELLSKGAEIIYGEACVNEAGFVLCGGKSFQAEKIIIATGSKPFEIKGLESDGKFILNSDQIFDLKELPKKIVIVGSGAIGIEWTRIFNNLGCETIIVEKAPNLLPASDIDVSKRIERIFKMKKIKFYTNCTVERIENQKLHLSNGETIEPDCVLSATGRERVVVEAPNTFKIGDANFGPMLAHNAIAEAKALFEYIFEGKELREIKNIPSVIYGNPEIASIGVREGDIEDCKIYNLPIAYLAKAHCDGNIEGFIKIISKNGEILGAHIISAEASAMITQIAIAMKAKMTVDELREVIFPHPTLSEGIFEALENG